MVGDGLRREVQGPADGDVVVTGCHVTQHITLAFGQLGKRRRSSAGRRQAGEEALGSARSEDDMAARGGANRVCDVVLTAPFSR